MAQAHVVGAGMAGLAAALRLSARGHKVTVYDAARHAGGRCRSFYEDSLDHVIDNGNHLMLAGNTAIAAFLAETGAADGLPPAAEARIPFVDLKSGERWAIQPNPGRLPWWIFSRKRRVAGSGAWDYLSALRLAWAGRDATVRDLFGANAEMYRRFWAPLAVAILNTPPEEASARLLWPVMVETFGRGGDACRPRFAREGLSESLIDPAVGLLRRRDVDIRFGHRLRQIDQAGGRVQWLDFGADAVEIGPGDAVVLAVTAPVAAALLPGLRTPSHFHPIVNVHFRPAEGSLGGSLGGSPGGSLGDDLPPILGIIGGTAEWVFCRGPIVSVTISAADRLADANAEAIAEASWRDVSRALGLPATLPPYRVIREKRATFAQTPAEERLRPATRTTTKNLFLAGDWTATGLPATIEGAARSGFSAADIALRLLERADSSPK
jgi:hydroxysqualene dehydroxylase